jgi:deoxyribonuclease V
MPEVQALHSWDLDPPQASALQIELASRVNVSRALPSATTVAGADVSFDLRGKWLYAAVVVVRAGTSEVVERSGVVAEVRFPYIPGLFSFREAPPLIEAYRALREAPDVLLVDGQGIAHPRRIGLASHLGLWLGLPTIGCAKSRLIGEHADPGPIRGDWTPLLDAGQTIGAVLRTRDRVKPLYVSPGHLCNLDSAIQIVLLSALKYRIPVPAQLAHQYVNDMRHRVEQPESPAQ